MHQKALNRGYINDIIHNNKTPTPPLVHRQGTGLVPSQPLDHGSGTVCQPGLASPTTTSENFVGSWSRFCLIDTAAHSDYCSYATVKYSYSLTDRWTETKNTIHHNEAVRITMTNNIRNHFLAMTASIATSSDSTHVLTMLTLSQIILTMSVLPCFS